MLQGDQIYFVDGEAHQEHVCVHIELIFIVGEGFIEKFEDATEYKESKVGFSVGDGMMVVGYGSGRLHEGLINGSGLAISDVVS